MEAVVKFKITDDCEEYAKGKLQNMNDRELTQFITDIIREAIVENGVYYDWGDAEQAAQEILPTISSIILNPRYIHLKMDYSQFLELVTFLTIRLA